MKPCRKCGETKPLDGFNRSSGSADGLHAWCRECARAHANAWYMSNRDRALETKKRRHAETKATNPGALAKKARDWRRANPEASARLARAAKFRRWGLGDGRYEALLAAQGGGCAICGALPSATRDLSVDHDHSCCPNHDRSCGDCVRGLLCSNCNSGLGMFDDSPERIRAAAAYLTGAREVIRNLP